VPENSSARPDLRKESKDYDVFLEGSVKDEKTENYHC